MGKKKSGCSSDATAADVVQPKAASAFVRKVATHCRCDGCGDKIRTAVKDLTLRCEGILSLDQSTLGTHGELTVMATADSERLRRRLRNATGKTIDLVFPKPPPAPAAADAKDAAVAAAATVQALLAGLQLLQQQPVHVHHGYPVPAAAGAWNAALQHGRHGHATYHHHHPWVLQQQQVPPEPYYASYPTTTGYPTVASWGAYPHDDLGGAYGDGGGWLGY